MMIIDQVIAPWLIVSVTVMFVSVVCGIMLVVRIVKGK